MNRVSTIGRIFWGLVWAAVGAMPCSIKAAEPPGQQPPEPADVRFLIGHPDGYLREFGLVGEGYSAFARMFTDPIVYTVGTSRTTDWPYIHPAPRDQWAGGKTWTFQIRYFSPQYEPQPLHLVLGICGAHPGERSEVVVTVNGQELPRQTAPGGATEPCFQRNLRGKPDQLIFRIPAGQIVQGENTIAVRLENQSWILYDYVALRQAAKPLAIVEPPEPNLLAEFLQGPMQGVDHIVFAVRQLGSDGHWYANFGYYAATDLANPYFEPFVRGGKRVAYGQGGSLRAMDLRSGQVAVLLDDPQGGVRDPVVSYDGRRILFSYRPGGTDYYHLYEISADGTGLRRLTDGPFDDIEPCYLPDGDIVFVSSRCKRWVNCWVTQVAVLYRCDADGGNIRPISANIEHDNTPWPLPDGRLLYTRWEYVDRSQVDYHHLWTTNPDGTGQMVYYGNMHPGIVMIDAKPIPGTKKVAAIFSPGHGRREHDGSLVVVDPSAGPDVRQSAKTIYGQADLRDPWAFSEEAFLAARGTELVLVDRMGRVQTIYRLSSEEAARGLQCHEPRPLVGRLREPVIPRRVEPERATGRLVLADIYRGRNMAGVQRGEIKRLMVLETLPKPINFTGGMDPLTYGGSFTLERILGTVPVEPDGSAYLEVPAMRGLFFVALDEQGIAVKRMQSFLAVQPGEVIGCVGCHEQRTQTNLANADLAALRRPPSRIEPIEDYPDVFDFPRDVQPILDRHCVGCHGYEKTDRGGPYAGKLILTGDRGPMFSHAYFSMTVRQLFRDGRNLPVSNYPPRTLGSPASRILQMLDGTHYGVQATAREKTMLRLWIDSGAPYPGTYAALGCGAVGGYQENHQVNTDFDWPTTQAAAEVIERRCAACHQGDMALPKAISDEIGISFWRFSLDDPRLKLSRHILFNLSRPEHSLLLLAPLAEADGGWQLCRQADGRPAAVLGDRNDADYRTLLAMVVAGKEELERIKRFDMPGFVPRPEYVREMQRYGVLPSDLPLDRPFDAYAVDRAYWRSLWHRPAAE